MSESHARIEELELARLRGVAARLDGTISLDPFVGDYELEHRLEVTLDGAGAQAFLELGGLRLPVQGAFDPAGLKLTFEDADEIGDGVAFRTEALGELRLGSERRPAAADRIELRPGGELTVRVVARVTVDTGRDGPPIVLDVTAPLELGPVTVLVEDDDGGDAAALEIAAEHLDLERYDIERDDGVSLRPRAPWRPG